MDPKTIEYYNFEGSEIAKRYESVPSPVARYFSQSFHPGSSILEIGLGSGRDLAVLHACGYEVLGIEPSTKLRQVALQFHPELEGRIIEGSLPNLTVGQGCFDAVLCSAVLMHIPSGQLFDAAIQIRDVLKSNGRLLLSLPLNRGDVHSDHRDPKGRLFSPYTPEQIETLFTRLGFVLISRWDSDDAMCRAETTWFTQLFEYRALAGVRPLDQIEAVLNRDRKEATYNQTGPLNPLANKRD